MSDHLRLRLAPDPDGTAELFVEAARGGFSGASSAWVGVEQLRELGESLQTTFPITSGAHLVIEGGYWGSAAPPVLEQRHVGLRFYPVGSAGKVGVHVSLMTPLHSSERSESRSAVEFEITTYYEALRDFGRGIVALSAGGTEVAELRLDAS